MTDQRRPMPASPLPSRVVEQLVEAAQIKDGPRRRAAIDRITKSARELFPRHFKEQQNG